MTRSQAEPTLPMDLIESIKTQTNSHSKGEDHLAWLASCRVKPRYQDSFGGVFPFPIVGMGSGATKAQAQAHAIDDALYKVAGKKHRGSLGLGTTPWRANEDLLKRIAGAYAMDLLQQKNLAVCWSKATGTKNLEFTFSIATPQVLFGHVVICPSFYGGHILGAGTDFSESKARENAVRDLFFKERRVQNIVGGREQLLDRIQSQRVWVQATSSRFSNQMIEELKQCLNLTTGQDDWLLPESSLRWDQELLRFITIVPLMPLIDDNDIHGWFC